MAVQNALLYTITIDTACIGISLVITNIKINKNTVKLKVHLKQVHFFVSQPCDREQPFDSFGVRSHEEVRK